MPISHQSGTDLTFAKIGAPARPTLPRSLTARVAHGRACRQRRRRRYSADDGIYERESQIGASRPKAGRAASNLPLGTIFTLVGMG